MFVILKLIRYLCICLYLHHESGWFDKYLEDEKDVEDDSGIVDNI